MFTVAVVLFKLPSETLKVKLSEPVKFVAGKYDKLGTVPDKVPLAGFVRMV